MRPAEPALSALAQEALAGLRPLLRPGHEAELYLHRGAERSVELRDGALAAVQESRGEGTGLRVLCAGRMAFASAGRLDAATVRELYGRARAALDLLTPEPNRRLGEVRPEPPDPGLGGSLWDAEVLSEPSTAVASRLAEMDAEIRSADGRVRSVLRAGYGESWGEAVVASTLGVLTCERGASSSIGASVLSVSGQESQVGSSFQSARRRSSLDWGRIAREAAERSLGLLGSRKADSGRMDVIFDAWSAAEFLELIAGLLCADSVQMGTSLLGGRLGRKVASRLATFRDEPRLAGAMASCQYDDEGCPTRDKEMIAEGVLREYFHDATTARKDGLSSNGSGMRASYRGLPGPGPTNFYLAPGPDRRESILSGTRDGILAVDVMGMHTADPISGEFSVGISGIAVRAGRMAGPVKGAMVSGNLLEVLDRLDAVGNDLAFYGSLGCPTFRVAGLNVA